MTDRDSIKNDPGKVAVLIGGSTGIGQSTAIELAKNGIGVILTYNSHRESADETIGTIESIGGKAIALKLDAGQSESFASFADSVEQELERKWGRSNFDYLVNNAGFAEMATVEETSEELFDRLIAVNLKAPFFITQKLLPI